MTKIESDAMLVLFNVAMEPSNLKKKKKKGTTICDKRTVKFEIGTVQCENGTVKCEKKVREPLNVRKKLSHVMLELHNVKMEPSNVTKKIREPLHMTKELSHVMLELQNVRIKPLNVKKKK